MKKELNDLGELAGIYVIKNTINQKVYVGQTQQFGTRARQHEAYLKRGVHKNPHLQAAWNKYGPDAFIFLVVSVVADSKERNVVEQMWLDVSFGDNCYNKVSKSQLTTEEAAQKRSTSLKGRKLSEETKKKMSEARLGKNLGRKLSEEHKQKMREANLGKKHSEETKQKLRELNLGKKPSEEAKKKTAEAKIGKARSEETKQKIREAHLGKKHSEETKKKMSEVKKGKFKSEETKMKMAEGQKLKWERRKAEKLRLERQKPEDGEILDLTTQEVLCEQET